MKEVDSTRSILRNKAEIIFRIFKYMFLRQVLYIPVHNCFQEISVKEKKKRKQFFHDDIYFNIELIIIQRRNIV